MKNEGASPAAKADRKPLLALTMGDPCGIGPEIVLKALGHERVADAARIIVLGDEVCLRTIARELKIRWPFGNVATEAPQGRRWTKPQLVDQHNVDAALVPGQIAAACGSASVENLEKAVALARSGAVDGLVTAPIHKESMSLAGLTDPGHTDLVARLAEARKFGLLFWADPLAVGLLSTHLALRDAIKRVKAGRLFEILKLYDDFWRRTFGRAPRVAVAALNPHGGEGMRFGTEEAREIRPAIEKAREAGILVSGPISADTVFVQARDGRFDLVVSLFHDQATIPVKLLWGLKAVTITVGLPFVRTSVEHGPAMDIAGKGTASEGSLVEAIQVAARLVEGQARRSEAAST